MVGSATFTMVRSIMSISAPTIRTAAASQRSAVAAARPHRRAAAFGAVIM